MYFLCIEKQFKDLICSIVGITVLNLHRILLSFNQWFKLFCEFYKFCLEIFIAI